MEAMFFWIFFSIMPTLVYLFKCSLEDLTTRTISKKTSIIMIILGLVTTWLLSAIIGNWLLLILWLIEMLVIFLPTFALLKKGFGGGDVWMLLAIQSNNPLFPIPFVGLLVHGLAGTTAFAFRKKWEEKDITIPFAPFYFISYLAIVLVVLSILFLL